jgi:hypothetical protein
MTQWIIAPFSTPMAATSIIGILNEPEPALAVLLPTVNDVDLADVATNDFGVVEAAVPVSRCAHTRIQ